MKQKKLIPLLYLLWCFGFTTGCVATSGIPDAFATTATDAALAKKNTYAWYQEKPVAGIYLETGFTEVLDKHVKRAIEEELEQKGLQKVTTNPDLLVAYDVSVSVPIELDKPSLYAPGFGYSYAWEAGYRYKYGTSRIEGFRPVDLYKEGTMIIDIIDRASGELIWRGWSEGLIRNFNANYNKVKENVQLILDKFPVE
ncbi:DUF4136 domain-containing protein [Botryobacter ruber]|uniref:DUF4136 domain-containing protein n=1 Tax=Botryobacter ruber TaxID=2171629 RepID=UPI000E0A989F|nr:DUF4136 domain-containing protein [Botryobacter ruber]